MKALLLSVLLALAAAAPSTRVETAHEALLFGAPEEILERALIPSDRNAHGEVRLVRRGDALCVQTVLCSPALVRGVQAIEKKERAAWPEGVEGHEDSARFLEALRRATELALEEFAQRADGSDARRKLLIELTSDGESSVFALYGIDVDTAEQRLDVTAARPFVVEEASEHYVRGAQRLQLSRAFHLEGDALETLLR